MTQETRLSPVVEMPPGRSRTLAGIVVIAAACMPILGSTSIAPIQPALVAAFPSQAGAAILVTLILTAPSLIIGLSAVFAGRIVDAVGRKRVLVVALFVYAVLGTAPLWLPDLPSILVSRIGVGFAEAAIFAASTATIADLFTGQRRARFFGLLSVATGLMAVVFIALSGVIAASSSWRASFWLYALALPIAVLAMVALPAFARTRTRAPLPALDWRSLVRPVLLTFIGGIIFYAPVSMLAYRLSAVGVHSPGEIGAASALAALSLAVTAMMYPTILKRRPDLVLPLAFGLLGVGLLVIGLSESAPLVIVGATVANAGGGLLLPSLQNWTVQRVGFEQRGRASGAWTAATFFGNFLGPLLVLGLASSVGLGWALAVVGMLGLVMAVVSRFVASIHPNTETEEPLVIPLSD